MIPPKHLEYYVTEWVAAALEAIVSHRLFPSVGLPYANRVNVIRPTHVSHETWTSGPSSATSSATSEFSKVTLDETEFKSDLLGNPSIRDPPRACEFSEEFIPESARYFQVEVPQVESLRAALLSAPRFNLLSAWQLRVTVVLHNVPTRPSNQLGQGTAASTPRSAKVHDLRSGSIRLNGRPLSCSSENAGRPPLLCGSAGVASISGTTGTDDLHRDESPLSGLGGTADGQAPFFLEQWVLSFNPSASHDWDSKSEYRKLCTALKGLMAAIHFLPTHSALVALTTAENTFGGRGEQKGTEAQQNPFLETHIYARWQGTEMPVRHGRRGSAAWTPLASYLSDLDNMLVGRFYEATGRAAGGLSLPVEGLCHTGVNNSPTSRMTVQTQKPPSLHGPAAALQRNLPSQWRAACGTGRGSVGASDRGDVPCGSPVPVSDSLSLSKCWLKQHALSAAGGSRAPSLPTVSCRSSAFGYAASSSTKLETCETRSLLSLSTNLGIIECIVTYNEELAQAIVAAKELETIDGCLHEFHPIADSSYAERDHSECADDGGTVISDTDPWLDMEDPCSSLEGLLPQSLPQVGLAADDFESASSPRALASGGRQEGGGMWSSLRRASLKRARHLASLPVCGFGLGPLMERQPHRSSLRVPASEVLVAPGNEDEGVEGSTWVPSPLLPADLPDLPPGRAGPSKASQDSGHVGSALQGGPVFSRDLFPAGPHVGGSAVVPYACDELGAERSGEFGESLKPEEGALLGEDDFGAMWLNSATSFSLAFDLPMRDAYSAPAAESRGTPPFTKTARAVDVPSLPQSLGAALASEDAAAALGAMRYLSDALHALERVVDQLFPDSAPAGPPEFVCGGSASSPPQEVQEKKEGAFLFGEAAPSRSKPANLAACWREAGLAAAAVGAQQVEARVFRDLCLAELDSTIFQDTCCLPLDAADVPAKEAPLSSHQEKARFSCCVVGHWQIAGRRLEPCVSLAAASCLLSTASSLEPLPQQPTALKQGLSQLHACEGMHWLAEEDEEEEDGESEEEPTRLEEQQLTKPQSSLAEEAQRDPWNVQEMLGAEVENGFLSLGLVGLP
ncbi:hypothetical protein Esti_000568 [Eimeria stiedai]